MLKTLESSKKKEQSVKRTTNRLNVLFSQLKSFKAERKERTHEAFSRMITKDNNIQSKFNPHWIREIPKSQHTITKTALIMDLEEKKMWVTDGQPCVAKFEEFNFN